MKYSPIPAISLALLFLPLACRFGTDNDKDRFVVYGDSSWLECQKVIIELLDDSGMTIDTLFDDSLRSLTQLGNLDADRYHGGKGSLHIVGINGAELCFEQIRKFDRGGIGVHVDTLSAPMTTPARIVANRESVKLVMGGPPAVVSGAVLPIYADQRLRFKLDESGVASLNRSPRDSVRDAEVFPLKPGRGTLNLASARDSAISLAIQVVVDFAKPASVKLDKDSLLLVAHGPNGTLTATVLPKDANPGIRWTSENPAIVAVDSMGGLEPLGEGQSVIKVVSIVDTALSAATMVRVVADVPRLALNSPDSARVGDTLRFVVSATQKYGHLVRFAWDLDGDGIWEDSLEISRTGDSVTLPPVSHAYSKEGKYPTRFLARDSEGNDGILEVTVSIAKWLAVPPPPASVSLNRDSVRLFSRGPTATLVAQVEPWDASQEVVWTSSAPSVLAVDAVGILSPLAAGTANVRASSKSDTSKHADAWVTVVKDAPVITIDASSTAAPHQTISFDVHVSQQFGSVVFYAWDMDGDDSWDDSLSGDWSGTSANLPSVAYAYAKEGTYSAKFIARDGEGNQGSAVKTVIVINRAPQITAIRVDTTISIQDSIAMSAMATDADGKVTWIGWDYDGDGKFDDSLMGSAPSLSAKLGHRYPTQGTYIAIFCAMDEQGKATLDTATIQVLLDPPVAEAGQDTTVTVEAKIPVSAGGTDGFGPIVKREIKIGDGNFIVLGKRDTSIIAPASPGKLFLVVKVTDSDGLSDLDTLIITVEFGHNADLSNFTLSAPPLKPVFSPTVLHYSADLANTDSIVSVIPTGADGNATLTVNGKTIASGSPSPSIRVMVGGNPNAFVIVVTAQDGSTQKQYDLSLNRAPSTNALLADLNLTAGPGPGLSLDSLFSPMRNGYSDTVGHDRTAVVFTPKVASGASTVSIDGETVQSGIASHAFALQVGPNAFDVKVTAQDGSTTNTYLVAIHRKGRLVLVARTGATATPTAFDSLETAIGDSRPIAAPALTGFHFLRWSTAQGLLRFSDSTASNSSVTLMAGDARAQAQYDTNVYNLAVTSAGSGTVRPDGIVQTKHGVPLGILATDSSGFHFTQWTASGPVVVASSSNPSTTVTSSGDGTVIAHFNINKYQLDVTALHGSIGKSPDQSTYDHGATVTVTPLPQTGYHFTAWGGDLSGSENPSKILMEGNKSVSAGFAINQYTLNTHASNGSLGKSPNQPTYDHGTSVTLTPQSQTGYHFTGWSGDLSGNTNPATLGMDGNKEVWADFAINKYPLSVQTVNGTVARIPDLNEYEHGTQVTLSANPSAGYHFRNWSGDISETSNPTSTIMDSTKNVTANFVINTYVLSIDVMNDPDPNYAVYVYVLIDSDPTELRDGHHEITRNHGENVRLTWKVGDGCGSFLGWSGDASGYDESITIQMDRNKRVQANFENRWCMREIKKMDYALAPYREYSSGSSQAFRSKSAAPRSIGPEAFELDGHAPLFEQAQPLVRQRRPKDVSTEPLLPLLTGKARRGGRHAG